MVSPAAHSNSDYNNIIPSNKNYTRKEKQIATNYFKMNNSSTKMMFYSFLILTSLKVITARNNTNYLINFRGEKLLAVEMEVDFNTASDKCHDALGGRFPVIKNQQDIEDLDSIGLDDVFLEVEKKNNKEKPPPLSEKRTYQWSDGSSFAFHPWKENHPNCTEDCCTVIYSTKRIYDDSCDRTFSNFVCILPAVKNITDEEKKQLVQSILDSSSEKDVKMILDLKYDEIRNGGLNINKYIQYRAWMGKDVYFDPSWRATFYEAMIWCSALGGQLPSVHSQQEMDSLNALADGVPVHLGAYPVDTRYEGSAPYNRTTTFAWQDGSTFQLLNWFHNNPDEKGPCTSLLLDLKEDFHSWLKALRDAPCEEKYNFVCILPTNRVITKVQNVVNRLYQKQIKINKNMIELEEANQNIFLSMQSVESSLESIQDTNIIILTLFGIIFLILAGLLLFLYNLKKRLNYSSNNSRVLYKSDGDNSLLSISPRG